jgi:hypothetical protein
MAQTLALTLVCAAVRAETLEGQLERGPTHSVLWFVSPESGDLIGQAFANTSQAGQTILARCLPGLHCVVEDASTAEPPGNLAPQLAFDTQPSGWWLVTQAGSAHMQPSLPMRERQLRTRHGLLTITEEHLLLLDGRPVLASPPPAAPQAGPAPDGGPRTLLERIGAWWHGWWSAVRGKLLALLGRAPASAGTPQAPAATAAPQPSGTLDAVQGNAALHIVAHHELEGQDIVLLQDTGGTACPALYRFATLTPRGIAVTPEFGTCSDIAAITLGQPPGGAPEPLVTMTGFFGPFEPEMDQQRAHMQLHGFALRQGQVQETQAPR